MNQTLKKRYGNTMEISFYCVLSEDLTKSRETKLIKRLNLIHLSRNYLYYSYEFLKIFKENYLIYLIIYSPPCLDISLKILLFIKMYNYSMVIMIHRLFKTFIRDVDSITSNHMATTKTQDG